MVICTEIVEDALKLAKSILCDEKIDSSLLSQKDIESIKEVSKKDLDFFYESDPAADSLEEIKIAYPGYNAILLYRIAHILFKNGKRLEARVISEYAHSKTGIDINPGAEIASPFFIDHGTGIVIGETTIIGKRVRIYQSVTLGALSPHKGQKIKGVKRHPTIKDDVTIYAGATILGDVTIGSNVTIGGGVYINEDIPANSIVKLPKPILQIIDKK